MLDSWGFASICAILIVICMCFFITIQALSQTSIISRAKINSIHTLYPDNNQPEPTNTYHTTLNYFLLIISNLRYEFKAVEIDISNAREFNHVIQTMNSYYLNNIKNIVTFNSIILWHIMQTLCPQVTQINNYV